MIIEDGVTMTNEEAIKWLNEMMPKWDCETNIYCAETCYGLGKYICTEPEGYVFKTAIEALEKQEKYRWHDLRKNPEDLPEEDCRVYIAVQMEGYISYVMGDYGTCCSEKPEWRTDDYYKITKCIAWRYIEQFDGVEQ